MVGVGGVLAPFRCKHQMMTVHEIIETVPAYHTTFKSLPEDKKQFVSTDTGGFCTDFIDHIQQPSVTEFLMPKGPFRPLVIGQTCLAKQLTQTSDAYTRMSVV